MEVINGGGVPEKPDVKHKNDTVLIGGIYLGTVLVLVGLLWLAYNLEWISPYAFDAVFSWRMLLVVIGGYLLAVRQYISGIVVGGTGLVMILFKMADISLSFSKVVIPVLIVVAGVLVIVSRIRKSRS